MSNVNQFGGAFADDMRAEQAVILEMEQQFQQAFAQAQDLAAGSFAEPRDAGFVRHFGRFELFFGLANHAHFRDRVDAEGEHMFFFTQ